jgi:Transposase IS66 family
VLVTVHAKRGKDGMTAAGVLPLFTGIAVHDAWKPYDAFDNVAGHALCGAHVLRELVAVTETGTDLDRAWAQQAIDALLALDEAAGAARAAGKNAIDPEALKEHEDWYRKAAAAGIVLNAGRHGKLQEKRHALATRMQAREADYLRFARDLRVPFTNNPAEQVIRMSKLRIKVSGCMRSMSGAETFCAIRSYLATAARHGTGWLDALTRAAEGNPWIPAPPDTHPAAGIHSVPCPAARRASSISLSFAGDSAPARSIRSSRLRVVSQVHGVKPGRGNTSRSTPSKGSPSRTPTATSTPRPEMSAPAGATTCIARNPDGPSSDSSTTGRRSSNSTHQTSPRRMCPPGHEMAGKYYAGRRWK